MRNYKITYKQPGWLRNELSHPTQGRNAKPAGGKHGTRDQTLCLSRFCFNFWYRVPQIDAAICRDDIDKKSGRYIITRIRIRFSCWRGRLWRAVSNMTMPVVMERCSVYSNASGDHVAGDAYLASRDTFSSPWS